MGKQYEAPLRRLVRELGPSELTAFIASDGVDPRYQEHIRDTLERLGVTIAAVEEEANLIFVGYTVRESDGSSGLEIDSKAIGLVHLFPDGAANPVVV